MSGKAVLGYPAFRELSGIRPDGVAARTAQIPKLTVQSRPRCGGRLDEISGALGRQFAIRWLAGALAVPFRASSQVQADPEAWRSQRLIDAPPLVRIEDPHPWSSRA